MYKFCKNKRYNLVVDFSLHPVAKFLEYEPHSLTQYVHSNRNRVDFIRDFSMDRYLRTKFQYNNSAIISTNMSMSNGTLYDANVPEEISNYVRKLLKPSAEMNEYINQCKSTIPEKYNIIHYRLGDRAILELKDTSYLEKWYQHLRKHYQPNDVLFTDSPEARAFVAKRDPTIITFKHSIGHVGYEKNDIKVKNTLVEFFIMSGAQKIKSFTTYCWISGFPRAVHHTFNVPLYSETNVKF